MKILINKILKLFNLRLIKHSTYVKFLNSNSKYRNYELFELINQNNFQKYFENLKFSKSQLGQDLFVLNELNFKQNGYFVEFGATNGIDLSNTYLMENRFNWKGILAEPAKIWHQQLQKNRKVYINTDCVWKDSKSKLLFNEVGYKNQNSELSTIDIFSRSDSHEDERKHGKKYEVNTISLNDLLKKYNAPIEIDYLSIDTEGSEFEILKKFDFNFYKVKVITCEHNYTTTREKIFELLTKNGFKRVHQEFSLFDDWYIRS